MPHNQQTPLDWTRLDDETGDLRRWATSFELRDGDGDARTVVGCVEPLVGSFGTFTAWVDYGDGRPVERAKGQLVSEASGKAWVKRRIGPLASAEPAAPLLTLRGDDSPALTDDDEVILDGVWAALGPKAGAA